MVGTGVHPVTCHLKGQHKSKFYNLSEIEDILSGLLYSGNLYSEGKEDFPRSCHMAFQTTAFQGKRFESHCLSTPNLEDKERLAKAFYPNISDQRLVYPQMANNWMST